MSSRYSCAPDGTTDGPFQGAFSITNPKILEFLRIVEGFEFIMAPLRRSPNRRSLANLISGAKAKMYGTKAPQGTQYHCRGCGEKLPPNCYALFHPECLKADKRLRTQEKRSLESERRSAWFARQKCLVCNSVMSQQSKRGQHDARAAHGTHAPRHAA